MSEKKDYLVSTKTGDVWLTSKVLAKRGDMSEFRGTYDQAVAYGKSITGKTPAIAPVKEPTADEPTVDRVNMIASAITKLDKDNVEHYTKDELPRIEAIEAILGADITASERDEALAMAEAG